MKKIILLFTAFATFGCASINTALSPGSSKPVNLAKAPEQVRRRWKFHVPGQISQVSMSRNGKWILLSSSQERDGAARVRFLESKGSSVKVLWVRKIKAPVKSQVLSPDGRYLIVSTFSNQMIVYNPAGKILWEKPHLGRPAFMKGHIVLINDDDSKSETVFFVYSLKGALIAEVKSKETLLDAFPGMTSQTIYAAFKSKLVTQYDLRGKIVGTFEPDEPTTGIVEDGEGNTLVATSRSLCKFRRSEKVWRVRNASAVDAIGVLDGAVVAHANTKDEQWLAGFEPATGKTLWLYSYAFGSTFTLPFWSDAQLALAFFDVHSNGMVQSAGLTADGRAQFGTLLSAPNGYYGLAASRINEDELRFVVGGGSPKDGLLDYYSADR